MSKVTPIAPAEFTRRLARLKAELGVNFESDVAKALGMSLEALCNRRRRGSFPEDDLRSLARHRPDLGIDVEYVLAGRPVRHAVSPNVEEWLSAQWARASSREELLKEALDTQVPSMAYGFVISTPDGEIHVGTGSFAVVIQSLVRTAIIDQLRGEKAV